MWVVRCRKCQVISKKNYTSMSTAKRSSEWKEHTKKGCNVTIEKM